MILNKQVLRQLIIEELEEAKKRGAYKTDSEKKKTKDSYEKEKAKESALNPTKEIQDDFKSLANGIMEKSKKKKKQASPGNRWHDSDGEWTSKDKAAVSSIANKPEHKNKKGIRGKARWTGSNERWVSQKCGREDVSTPNKKAKYKCKDGSLAESDLEASSEHVEVPHNLYDAARAQQKLEVTIKKLQAQLKKAMKTKRSNCPLSFEDAKSIIFQLKAAQSGKTLAQAAAPKKS